jgi:hypothetical protein
MRTIETKLYRFEELSKEAQEKAIEKNSTINVDHDFWHENVIEEWKEKLENIGFSETEIRFSGFWSQGDGASFISKRSYFKSILNYFDLDYKIRPNVLKLIEDEKIDFWCNVEARKYSPYCFYVHERTTEFNLDFGLPTGNYPNLEKYLYEILIDLNDLIYQEIVSINKEIYRSLEKEYDYLTKPEEIKETLIANDYEFTEEGEIY